MEAIYHILQGQLEKELYTQCYLLWQNSSEILVTSPKNMSRISQVDSIAGMPLSLVSSITTQIVYLVLRYCVNYFLLNNCEQTVELDSQLLYFSLKSLAANFTVVQISEKIKMRRSGFCGIGDRLDPKRRPGDN